MVEFLSQILNGLVIGNVYALVAIGFSLIFGVTNLINFAQGSLLMLGALFAFTGVRLGLPLPLAALGSVAVTTAVGMLIERVALRPLENAPWIAPLLSTLAITFILDQAAEIIWTPEAHAFPNPLSGYSVTIGAAYVTGMDAAILAISLIAMVSLYLFLTRSWAGRALRAMSQDMDAVRQMGVHTDRLRLLAFGLGSALAAVAGVMVAMYYQTVYPQMGVPFGLKGFTAALLGGLASIPGAVAGGLLLGVLEALAVGYVGEGFRDMVAFGILLVILTFRPQGLFGDKRLDALGGSRGASGVMPSTSILIGQGGQPLPQVRLLALPYPLLALAVAACAVLPLLPVSPYIVQVALQVAIFALLAAGLTMLSGASGIMFLGFSGFFGVGAYVAALSAKQGAPADLALLAAALVCAALAGLVGLLCSGLTGHVVGLATLAIGVLIWLVLLNWTDVTGGPNGVFGIPRPSLSFLRDVPMSSVSAQYWLALALLVLVVLAVGRLLASPLGLSWRAIREDRVAAHAAGLPVRRYLVTAFVLAGVCAGLAGGLFAFLQRFISPDSFRLDTSFLMVAIIVLGGLGNLTGALLGAAALIVLPETLREAAEFRMILFGLVLYLTLRFRPQGIAGVR
ncbi:ABC transporter permease [Bosea thiooxidans]|nr:ABC transporter permease [Bosea sp. (in: a-proteobacteria)]